MTDQLAGTQLWMQAAVTDPSGVADGAAEMVNGSVRLSAGQRLELYRRTYHQRLAGCLRETYPGVRHALGDELFDDFALEYLIAYPPRGASLSSLGAAFPEHLEATRPDRNLPPGQRERWPDFLVDLARLERMFWEVYDGPGAEGMRLPCAADDLPAELEVGRAPSGTLQAVACLRLLRASHPVEEYLSAVRRGERPAPPAPRERFIAVSRRQFVVTLTALEAREHALLAELVRGAEIGETAAALGLDGAEVWRLLRTWVERGWLAAIHLRSRRGTT
jgi:hypothetical protein